MVKNTKSLIDKSVLNTLIESFIVDTNYRVEDVRINDEDDIFVEIDNIKGVDMDFCARLNKFLSDELGGRYPNVNFSIEVGSVSLSAPFKSILQYRKHIGDTIRVIDTEGKVYSGRLDIVKDNSFIMNIGEQVEFNYTDVKKAEYVFN